MVKIDTHKGYIFYFWTNEIGGGGQIEPPHIHVNEGIPRQDGTKFWLDPVELAHNKSRIPDSDLRDIERYIKQNQSFFLSQWKQRFK